MLRVLINCELAPGTQAGGTQSVVSGLVRALGQLDGAEEYLLITHPENQAWLQPLIGANTKLVPRPRKLVSARKHFLQRWFTSTQRKLTGDGPRAWPEVPRSDGFYESHGAHVIHWPWQHFAVTAMPSVFNPHDILHLHYPQFFQPRDITAREAVYPVACRLARTVIVASEWTRDDIAARYAISADRMQVIPWAAPTAAAGEPDVPAARAKFSLPEAFAFFPAVTWEHKNHLRLLAALAAVRDRAGVKIPLICTGHRFERHAARVEAEVARLGLAEQVRFLGSVSFAELRAIYRAAEFVIIPTLFEAASGPMFEAWNESVPVACSTVTSLPQQAADAAHLFDPYDTAAIAAALEKMHTDPAYRAKLTTAGTRRLADFPWERTARAYRAVYRRAAGTGFTKADAELLAWDWMKERSNSR